MDQLKVFLVSFEKKNIYTKANDKKNGYIKNKLLLSFEVDERQREGKKRQREMRKREIKRLVFQKVLVKR